MTPTAGHHRGRTPQGFTIVELLVVIVIIAILATITILAYSGITKSAAASSLQSDLSNAATALKTFAIENNSSFPTTISTDCQASPDTSTNKCLKISPGNYYIGYSANNSSAPKTFTLIASNSQTANPDKLVYKVTDKTSPTQLASTLQPGVTPGAVLELHAAKANGGTSQGINDPLTTTWTDTSGNGNSGTLTNFTGTPWAGAGTVGDPWRLTFDGVNDYVAVADDAVFAFGTGDFTVEAWAVFPLAGDAQYGGIITKNWSSDAPAHGWGLVRSGLSTSQARFQVSTDAGGSWASNGTFSAVADGVRQLAVTRTTGTFRRHIDGAADGSPATPVAVTLTNAEPVKLGIPKDSSRALASPIILVRIYPFALTADQVAANYAAGVTW